MSLGALRQFRLNREQVNTCNNINQNQIDNKEIRKEICNEGMNATR